MQIDKVIALNIDVDDWDKYIGYMASDYRDIWINHYDLEENFTDKNFNGLLDSDEEYQKAKAYLMHGDIDYIALRCDID